MKKLLSAGLCSYVLLLSGCGSFKSPSASQSLRNEERAQASETRRSQRELDDAISARARSYERQGMSREQAYSAAQAETTAPRLSR